MTIAQPVFISYSTADSAAAEQMRDGLEAASIACWMAPRDIAPGLDYGTQIIDAIEACTVLVLVLSESSNYSIYVRKEVERAIAKRKVVIPVRIQQVTVSRSLEFFISDAQWIDAWDKAWARVTTTLHAAVSGHLASQAEGMDTASPAPSRSSQVADLLPAPTHHSPSATHQPPPVPRALFVGREAQMAELENALGQALLGHGQLRFVTGEAGAGKSALLAEFDYRAREQAGSLIIASGACDAQTGIADPYLPFREILTALAGHALGRAALLEHGPELVDTLVPGSALGSQRSGQGRAPNAKPVEQSHIFEQAVKVLQTIAQRTPLVLILEDLHWVDDASIGLLFRLGRQLGGSRILLLGTYRSEEVSLGRGGETHPLQKVVDELRRILGSIQIDLDAARDTEGTALVEALLDTQPNRLDATFRQTLHEHTGGHPLFLVELLRDLQNSNGLIQDTDGEWIVGSELNWAALPDRVEGIIAVRMARLNDEERQLLTTASVLGEHFIAEAVALALKIDGRQVALQLSGSLQKQHRLVQAEEMERSGSQRLSRYRFSHNLMQVYLYDRLDEVERSFIHEDVGNALEKLYGERVEEIAVQLAHHFQVAGLREKAIDYLIRAGKRALRMSARAEAATHFSQALALLAELPESDRAAELEARLGLGRAYLLRAFDDSVYITRAYEELDNAYAVAKKLGNLAGMARARIPTVHLLEFWEDYRPTAQANIKEALEISERLADPQLLTDAMIADFRLQRNVPDAKAEAQGEALIHRLQTQRDLVQLNLLYWGMMHLHLARGNYRRAVQICDDGIALAKELAVSPVMYPTLKALALIALGRFDDAWQTLQQEITDAEHPFGRAMQLYGLGVYWQNLASYTQAAAIFLRVVDDAIVLERPWLKFWGQIQYVRIAVRAGSFTIPDTELQTMLGELGIHAGQSGVDLIPQRVSRLPITSVYGREIVNTLAAELCLRQGAHQDALRFARSGTREAVMSGRRPTQALSLALEAEAHLQLQNPKEALAIGDDALQLAEELEAVALMWRVHSGRASAWRMLGEERASTTEQLAAANLVDRMADQIGDSNQRVQFMAQLKGE